MWGECSLQYTAWKVSKYGVISGPYFPAFGLNTERYEVKCFILIYCQPYSACMLVFVTHSVKIVRKRIFSVLYFPVFGQKKKLLIGTLFMQWQHKMLMKTGLKQCLKIYLSFSQIRLLFKINNRNTRTIFEICLNLTIKTPERL